MNDMWVKVSRRHGENMDFILGQYTNATVRQTVAKELADLSPRRIAKLRKRFETKSEGTSATT